MGDIVWQRARFVCLVYVSVAGQFCESCCWKESFRIISFNEICEIAVLNSVIRGVGSEKSECFALDEAFVTPDGWHLEKCVYWNLLVVWMSFNVDVKTASSSSHFWATKEMKYIWKFQKLFFRNKDKSRSSKIWQDSLILIACSRQRFCTFSDH